MDKKTIAKLDAEQLQKIQGGSGGDDSTGLSPGTSNCGRNSCRQGNSCNGVIGDDDFGLKG